MICACLGYDGRYHLPGPAVGTSHCGAPSQWRERWAFAATGAGIRKACARCFPVSPATAPRRRARATVADEIRRAVGR